MDISTEHRQGLAVVVVDGEVDLYTAPQLRDDLAAATAGPGAGVVLDLSRVGFLDSYGLGVVVHAFKACRAAGRGFAVVTSSPPVVRLFVLTGLDRAMPLHAAVDDAVVGLLPSAG